MNWEVLTAISAVSYTLLFSFSIFIGYWQWNRNRKFQMVLTVFRELKTKDFIKERRYIYEKFPENIDDLEVNQIKVHIHEAEEALTALHRIGYLVSKGQIDAEPILENYWPLIWRCWKKSEAIIRWAREQRNEKDYFDKFEYLFRLAEDYRSDNGYLEPRFF